MGIRAFHATDARNWFPGCQMLAEWSEDNREALAPIIQRYGEADDVDEPERLHAAGLAETRKGEVGLLRDLQDLHVLATLVQTTWTVIAQGAQGAGMSTACIHTTMQPEDAVALLQSLRRGGDVMLLKGSRGMAMERLVQALAEPEGDG